MVEYQIQPNTRRCAVTGRELRPGDRYFTALLEEGETFVRQDFSAEGWQGPPSAAFSFWTGRVPTATEPAKPPEIKVGLLLPLSGPAEAIGRDMLDAAQMALFDVGDNKLVLLPRDTAGTPAGARLAAQEVIRDGAEVILGPLLAPDGYLVFNDHHNPRSIRWGYTRLATAIRHRPPDVTYLPVRECIRLADDAGFEVVSIHSVGLLHLPRVRVVPTLCRLCDRLAVMSRGRLSPSRPIGEWTPEGVLHAAIDANG